MEVNRIFIFRGFLALKNNYEKILILVEMMYCGHGNKLPCFEKGKFFIDFRSYCDKRIEVKVYP